MMKVIISNKFHDLEYDIKKSEKSNDLMYWSLIILN